MNGLDGQARHQWKIFGLPLFDSDGLPWTSQLAWGWPLFLGSTLLILFVPLIGIYLGLWLRSKGRSRFVLTIYVALTGLFLVLFFIPLPESGPFLAFSWLVTFLTMALWLVGAFTLRYQAMRYYSSREGNQFPLNPFLTAIFASWYVGGSLRADFPLNEAGETGHGILKLIAK